MRLVELASLHDRCQRCYWLCCIPWTSFRIKSCYKPSLLSFFFPPHYHSMLNVKNTVIIFLWISRGRNVRYRIRLIKWYEDANRKDIWWRLYNKWHLWRQSVDIPVMSFTLASLTWVAVKYIAHCFFIQWNKNKTGK